MSKGLEALAQLYSYIKPSFDYQTAKAVEDYRTIEKELKDLDTIKKIFDSYSLEYKLTTLREAVFLLKQLQSEKSQCWDNALKKLKALEIIKDKKVDCFKLIAIMRTSNNLKHYNQNYDKQFQLTQDEYELLKEVLL